MTNALCTVKPRKWWPRKWRTSLDGGWYLDLLFLKWRGKTSENGGFFLGKLSNQYYYIIRVYNKLQVRLERTLRLKKNHFHVNFALRKLKKILYNLQKGLFKVI